MYHSYELREGVGCRVPAADGYVNALLDRAPPQRTPTVAGPGPHADGLAGDALLLDDVVTTTVTQRRRKQKYFRVFKECYPKKSLKILFFEFCVLLRVFVRHFSNIISNFFRTNERKKRLNCFRGTYFE